MKYSVPESQGISPYRGLTPSQTDNAITKQGEILAGKV